MIMIIVNLSETYKQHPCSVPSFIVVTCRSQYYHAQKDM